MVSFPNAKINLGLNVVGKREDGYHNLESCFFPIPLREALEIIEAKEFRFKSYGLSIPGDSANNLCVQAYKLLKTTYDLPPVEIHLVKAIPMGAGLGGGSADGAYTLTLLNELFKLSLTSEKLQEFALQLGSDCPFFIINKPALASGRGEKLKVVPCDLQGRFIALSNPGIHISTKEAYQGVTPAVPKPRIAELIKQPISDWKNALVNDFEASVFRNHPTIRELKEEMYRSGALYASMTGSGSTVFGIFDQKMDLADWIWLEV